MIPYLVAEAEADGQHAPVRACRVGGVQESAERLSGHRGEGGHGQGGAGHQGGRHRGVIPAQHLDSCE